MDRPWPRATVLKIIQGDDAPAGDHRHRNRWQPSGCDGTTAENGLYGEGIINASKAVARR